MSFLSPKKTAPTSFSWRLSASPSTPFGNSIISLSITSLRPSMRATPSPVSRTMPTLLLVVAVFSSPIFDSISSSMVLMVLNFIVRVEGVRGGFARFRPKHRFRRGSAFRQEAEDQRENQYRDHPRIFSSDWRRSLNVLQDPLRSQFRLWRAASPPRVEANVCNFLAR